MRGARHVLGLAIAGLPALALFLAQTLLIIRRDTEAVLALAQYGGALGLAFFAFDGQSGLAPSMLRLKHDDASVRRAYWLYRHAALLLFVLASPALFVLTSDGDRLLLAAVAFALLLRLEPLDVDLDRRDRQDWAMLAQNGWMIALAAMPVLFGRLDGTLAGLAAFGGTLPMALLHRRLPGTRAAAPNSPMAARRAFADLVAFMLAQGMGQLYGRAVLFGLGAFFTGPVATLAIYAKQVFNAAGLLLLYLRRLELRASRPSMRLSLAGQAGIAACGSIAVGLAASRFDLAAVTALLLIGWQCLEKLSATRVYAIQTRHRYDLAFLSLAAVMLTGSIGMALAVSDGTVMTFIAFEALGYVAALLVCSGASLAYPPLRKVRRP